MNLGTIYSTTRSPVPILASGETSVEGGAAYPNAVENKSVCKATHVSASKDADTGYNAPTSIEFKWAGTARDDSGEVTAQILQNDLGTKEGQGGLIEKVDVLAEIPYVIRKGLAAVTGTKPYVYQVGLPRITSIVATQTDSSTTRTPSLTSRSAARALLSTDGSSTRRLSYPSSVHVARMCLAGEDRE